MRVGCDRPRRYPRQFRYSDLLLTGADDTPYRLDLVAQGAQGPAVRLRVQLPSRSGSWPGIRLRSANSGAIISSMASRSALAVASKKLRARALLFSCSDDTVASSSFFLPTGVHLPRDGNIYDATRGARRIARRPIHRSAWKKNSRKFVCRIVVGSALRAARVPSEATHAA
jgi:hypothetical protein